MQEMSLVYYVEFKTGKMNFHMYGHGENVIHNYE